MSRTGYGDCYDTRTWGLSEGARARALAGNRGQALLRDLVPRWMHCWPRVGGR
jgi:hypothetical protein